MSTPEAPGGKLPPDLAKAIEGKDSGTTSTLLSMHRTGLSDLRSHLSNERTHLSYIRTCISMLGFGITINRFSVFMQEKEKLVADGSGPLLRSSEYAGAGMVVAGLVLLAWSLYRYWHVNQDIVNARFRPTHKMVIALTAVLLAGGGATVAWLFLLY